MSVESEFTSFGRDLGAAPDRWRTPRSEPASGQPSAATSRARHSRPRNRSFASMPRRHYRGDAAGLCDPCVRRAGLQDSLRVDDSHTVDRAIIFWSASCPTAFNGPATADQAGFSAGQLLLFANPDRIRQDRNAAISSCSGFPKTKKRISSNGSSDCPGDTIQVRNKIVFVNGVRSTTKPSPNGSIRAFIDGTINPRDNFGPVTVRRFLFRDGRQSRPKSGQPVLGICARGKDPRQGVPYLLVVERARAMDGVGTMGTIRKSHSVARPGTSGRRPLQAGAGATMPPRPAALISSASPGALCW